MRAVWILVLGVVAGCYRPSVDPCRVTCANDGECPSGTACGAGGRCHPAGEPTACTLAGDDAGLDASDPDAVPDSGPPAGAWKALAVGQGFGCAITADGAGLWCWGENFSGQLGDTTTVRRPWAQPIDEEGPWRALGAGSYHACAVKENGALFCWGSATYGQVDGTQENQTRPDPVEVVHPTGRAWVSVDGGARHTCAIDAETAMYCWGYNDQGQLGTGSGAVVSGPSLVTGHTTWTQLSADELRTCAVKSNGEAWCWGLGALGQATAPGGANAQSSSTPVIVAGGHSWRAVSTGRGHGCGVTTGNQLYCWGEEQIDELGLVMGNSGPPGLAQTGSDFGIVWTGPLTTCATRTGPDRLICFGDNRAGQLASGDRRLGQVITVAGLGRVIDGGAGYQFGCALEESGEVSCWGADGEGRCGDGVADDRFIGPSVEGIVGTVVRLTAMGDHTCALTGDGRVFCWGSNGRGQLGVGDTVDRASPVEVPRPGGQPWTDISAGIAHTCGVADGDLYCWGDDDSDQLGNGASGGATQPQQIGAATTWVSVSAAMAHTCAIDNNSQRWCWGDNVRDSIGGGSGTNPREPSPLLVGGGPATWLEIEGGAYFACGISGGAERQLWCWGDNEFQELGQGASPDTSNVPVRSQDPSTDWRWLALDVVYGAACGIRAPDGSGGELWCWGHNGHAQLGTGTTGDALAPTHVGTSRTWLRVDLGLNFACGISGTLELRCWGYNDSHQVSGSGFLSVPTIPASPTWPGVSFTELASGWAHTCAVTSAGAVLCWGAGGAGQLGDGNKANLLPTPVVTAAP